MGLISKAAELPVQPLVVRGLPARERRASGVASGLTPAAVRADSHETGRQLRSTDPDCRRRLAERLGLDPLPRHRSRAAGSPAIRQRRPHPRRDGTVEPARPGFARAHPAAVAGRQGVHAESGGDAASAPSRRSPTAGWTPPRARNSPIWPLRPPIRCRSRASPRCRRPAPRPGPIRGVARCDGSERRPAPRPRSGRSRRERRRGSTCVLRDDHPRPAPPATRGSGQRDELLRYASPVQRNGRGAREDVELGGKRIGAGDVAISVIGAANREPGVFEQSRRVGLRASGKSHHHLRYSGRYHSRLQRGPARYRPRRGPDRAAAAAQLRRRAHPRPGTDDRLAWLR